MLTKLLLLLNGRRRRSSCSVRRRIVVAHVGVVVVDDGGGGQRCGLEWSASGEIVCYNNVFIIYYTRGVTELLMKYTMALLLVPEISNRESVL